MTDGGGDVTTRGNYLSAACRQRQLPSCAFGGQRVLAACALPSLILVPCSLSRPYHYRLSREELRRLHSETFSLFLVTITRWKSFASPLETN